MQQQDYNFAKAMKSGLAMHQGEHAVTLAQARALIAEQMPGLAGLPMLVLDQSGTDNVLIRLGPALVARFPRLPHAEAQIALLTRFLPQLPSTLPLPVITHHGKPGAGYPFHWTIGPFLPGQDAHTAPPDLTRAAKDMASYLTDLHRRPVPPDLPSRTHDHRLDLRLGAAEHFIAQITEIPDLAPLYQFLTQARHLPPHQGLQVWTHGDLHPLNLLTLNGEISAVIDWGATGAGDPAMDLMLGWTLFDAPSRARFKAALDPDPLAWARGRAAAFGKAITALPYYRQSNPAFHAVMKQTLDRVLWEVSRSGLEI